MEKTFAAFRLLMGLAFAVASIARLRLLGRFIKADSFFTTALVAKF